MPSRFPTFSILIMTAAVLGHVYLYRRLVRDTVRSRALRVLAVVMLLLLTLGLLLRRTLQDALPEAFSTVFLVASYSWMGLGLFLVLALLVLDLGLGLAALGRRFRSPAIRESPRASPVDVPPSPLVDEERRRFLSRVVAGSAFVSGGGFAAYGNWRAFAPPRVTEVAVKIPKLPKSLDGFSIVQLTDIHVGPFIRREFMDELVRQTNALRPDLVAITGDLVDGDVPTLGGSVAALGNLKSHFGSFFVTGNHDYYSGDEAWTAFLETLDVRVLRNRHVSIGDAGGSFDLVGVDDWSGGRRRGRKGYDLDLALAGRDPDRASVLLAHQPANFVVAAQRGVDLQISGHTHGGQLVPMTFFIGLVWDHSAGLYHHGDSHIFVSRGCGFWGPPMRVGSPPEIVKLVLTA
ncbi:metallophosphoesterase [Archangium violaceum]|uniref:metallophosphoesterase n=1 Tax=Archangium violaceum TaxID=83451 RepID=UPI00193BDC2A|nr:metallophosphoesterase [Archangium violaceum]QRK07836.1 metallophosphoesterase [Archangium violaceum]